MAGPTKESALAAKALKMRADRVPVSEIAQQLGVSQVSVYNWIKKAVTESVDAADVEIIRYEETATLDRLERNALEALDELMNDLRGEVIDNDTGLRIGSSAANLSPEIVRLQEHVLNIQKRRAKLLGLDAPQRILHGVAIRKDYDEQLETLMQQLVGGGKILSAPDEILGPDGET